jgi:hypothetical protein
MKPKFNWFNAAMILIVGILAVLALVAVGESDVAWLIP